jgi:hypothetical protein
VFLQAQATWSRQRRSRPADRAADVRARVSAQPIYALLKSCTRGSDRRIFSALDRGEPARIRNVRGGYIVMLIPDTAVPRYFFYIHVDVDVARDVIGIDLPDLNEAIAEANKARLEIMEEETLDQLWLEIMDERGRVEERSARLKFADRWTSRSWAPPT